MTSTDQLTQPKYLEEWIVNIGKEAFVLNEKEIALLKKAITDGIRGIVWFDKFAFSIAHIQSIYRSKKILNSKKLPDGKNREYTAEDRQKANKKLKQMKEKFFIKK